MAKSIPAPPTGYILMLDLSREDSVRVCADDVLEINSQFSGPGGKQVVEAKLRTPKRYGVGSFLWLRPPDGFAKALLAERAKATQVRRESYERRLSSPASATPPLLTD
jgi:hypothetical protein